MTKEYKELLLADLCARLPYGVICYWRIGSELTLNLTEYNGQLTGINKVEIEDSSDYYYDCYFNVCNDSDGNSFQNEDIPIGIVKPYLRPMSSMTEEEKKKYKKFCIAKFIKAGPGYTYDGWWEYYDTVASFDYLNSIHVDYRGLIEKNLAIKVTKENNPYKNILI